MEYGEGQKHNVVFSRSKVVFFPQAVGIELDKFIRTETEELDKSVICFS